MKTRLPQQWLERDAKNARRTIDRLIEHARRAEIVTDGMRTPFWTEFLEPFLKANGHDALHSLVGRPGVDGKAWEEAQAVADRFQAFYQYITGLEGQRDEIMTEVERKSRLLSKAEADGSVQKEKVTDESR